MLPQLSETFSERESDARKAVSVIGDGKRTRTSGYHWFSRAGFRVRIDLPQVENSGKDFGIPGEMIVSDAISETVVNFPDTASLGIPISAIPANAEQSRFDHLAEKWKKETGHLSRVTKRCMHPAYQQIIGMGAAAVPLILNDLKTSRDDWFWALSAITGENPITETDAGNVPKMTEAWMQWARSKGYDV